MNTDKHSSEKINDPNCLAVEPQSKWQKAVTHHIEWKCLYLECVFNGFNFRENFGLECFNNRDGGGGIENFKMYFES